MSIFHAIILGIVEGLTEFLPISSTAHLVITSHLLGILQSDFTKTFEIVIQLGAIAAVGLLYAKKLIKQPQIIGKIVAGFVPTAIIGFALYKIIKNYLLGNMTITAWALTLGGIGIILFEKWYQKKQVQSLSYGDTNQNNNLQEVSYPVAIWMGFWQALAVIPGVSRSAATIMSGMSKKISREAAVEFSFLLAAPTMLGAAALDIYKDPGALAQGNIVVLLIGLIVSFAIAYITMKWLLKYVQTHSFTGFGWYRILIGVIILLFLI